MPQVIFIIGDIIIMTVVRPAKLTKCGSNCGLKSIKCQRAQIYFIIVKCAMLKGTTNANDKNETIRIKGKYNLDCQISMILII